MNRIAPFFAFIFIAQLASSQAETGDLPNREIIQSPFYDALSVHFANMGYWVYFIPQSKVGAKTVPATNPPNNTSVDSNDPFKTERDEYNEGPRPNPETLIFRDPADPDSVSSIPNESNDSRTESADNYYLTFTIVNSISGNIIDTLILHRDSIYYHLKKHYYDEDGDTTREIISEVFLRNAHLDSDLGPDTINKVYSENCYWDVAFLKYIPEDQEIVKAEIDSLAVFSTAYISKEGAGIRSASIFAEGLAEFLIMRVSEEMDLLFISQLQQAFNKHVEIRTLFPNTRAYLKHHSPEDFYLALPALKKATEADLSNIIYNISELGDLERLKPIFNEHPSLSILFTVCKVAGLLQQNKTPAFIIHEIYTSKYLYHNTKMIHNPSSFFKLTGMLSNAMLDVRKGQTEEALTWIGRNKLLVLSNRKIYNIYSCLIYQSSPEITFKLAKGDTIHLKKLLHQVDFNGIYNTLIETESDIKKKLKANENTRNTDIERGNEEGKINLSILENNGFIIKRLMSTIYEIGGKLPFKDTEYQDFLSDLEYFDDYITPIITKAIATSKYIQLEQYSSAINEGCSILNDYLFQILEKHVTENDAISKDHKKLLKAFLKSKDDILRYGSFISSIAIAETSEDVAAAIKTFSLPAGSHRIKKEATFSVGLNGYLGFYNGLYKYNKYNGLTAPLGLSFNFGFGDWGGVSLSGYIIDVGAIVTSKIDSSKVISNEITWGNIFSPGFVVGYNLPILKNYSLPITIGYAEQWAPKIEGEYIPGALFKNMAPMHKLFIAFDIPITNFYVSRKRNKFNKAIW